MGFIGIGSRTAAAQRRAQAAPARSQRYNLSEEDSDKDGNDDDDEPDSQGPAERSLNSWLKKSKEETEAVAIAAPIYVKTERATCQPQTQNAKAGPSRSRKAAPVIDLTFETTDEETTRGKGKVPVKPRTNSQRSTSSKGTVVKKKTKTPPKNPSEVDRAKLQRMMSGGSGKSVNESIVLLDTDEEEVVGSAKVVSVCHGPRSHRFELIRLLRNSLLERVRRNQRYRKSLRDPPRNHLLSSLPNHLQHHIVRPWLYGVVQVQQPDKHLRRLLFHDHHSLRNSRRCRWNRRQVPQVKDAVH